MLEVLSQVFFRIVGDRDDGRADRRVRRDGVHVGTFGVAALLPLGRLMLGVYLTMALFIFIVLNLILRAYGFSPLGLPQVHPRRDRHRARHVVVARRRCRGCWTKMERYGCARPVVGLVIPAGYSFNLDGTSIYLSMAAIFIAQAFSVHLSIGAAARACSAC